MNTILNEETYFSLFLLIAGAGKFNASQLVWFLLLISSLQIITESADSHVEDKITFVNKQNINYIFYNILMK